jgi:NitT/TauT family transport system substrate-binding protein
MPGIKKHQEERMIATNLTRRLALIAATVLATGTAPAIAQGQGETLKISDAAGTGNLLARVAIAKGYCEQAGIKCELVNFASGPMITQALLAKSIDVGFAGSENVIQSVNRGFKVQIVAGGWVTGPVALVVGSDVATPNAGKHFPAWVADLKGKKIGVFARGAPVENMMNIILDKGGLKPADVTYVAVGGPVTAFAALANKQIDATINIEPISSMCAVSKKCATAWALASDKDPAELYAMNGAAIVSYMRSDFVADKPQVVEAFTNAMSAASKFVQDPANFEEVVAITEKYFKLEIPGGDAIVRDALKRVIPGAKVDVDRGALQATVDYMQHAKTLEKPVDVKALLYSKAL